MKRSMIALVSAGAITLALGGYAVGATRHDGAAGCERTNQVFEARAGQFRKQEQRIAQGNDTTAQYEIATAQLRILGVLVRQNPACFDAGARATATYLQLHPSTGQEDVAACDLAGIPARDCDISTDD
ncbi:hypothetical protein ACFV06_36745 [Streptomyces sp. NPDC059618]|uniref:hypothetical protein n=1 Tax=Streptomyces sp. NPDC059618 TaxID=3346887 RepID=UPI00369C52D1